MISKITLLILIGLFTFLSSCSSLVESTRKNLMGDSSPRKAKSDVKWVSKAQYDELLTKYKGLSKKYENLKDQKIQAGGSGFSQASELAAGKASTETIDVFGKNGISGEGKSLPPEKMDRDLEYYKKAVSFFTAKKYDEALKIFQFLEKSNSKQIQVRAKTHIGDIYFAKKQFDLALQVYESVITNFSFSGNVIQALRFAAKSCGELGLTDKKLKYESILKDFFEVRV